VGLYLKLSKIESDSDELTMRKERFTEEALCPVCKGTRLAEESLYFKVDGLSISEVSNMDMDQLHDWVSNLNERLSNRQQTIARDILKELKERTQFLLDVGLNYLSLSRSTRSLSGGESQRIRLATQIGSKLVNVLYILDEPSIGRPPERQHKTYQLLKKAQG